MGYLSTIPELSGVDYPRSPEHFTELETEKMKRAALLVLAGLILCTTTGCANGPVRNFLRGVLHGPCKAPAPEPSFGMGFDDTVGTCVDCQKASTPGYLGDGYADPYIQGSNFGGASINPPVFDSYSSPTYRDTTVPPASTDIMPSPGPGGF